MILFWRNALFHWEFPMTLWIFVFQMKFKNMILRFINFESFLTMWIFEGPRTDVFEAAIGRPWIEPNDAVFTLRLIFGLARNGLDFGPKNMNVHFAQGNTLCISTFTEETRRFRKVAKHFFVFLQWKWPSKCVLLRQNANFSCVVF